MLYLFSYKKGLPLQNNPKNLDLSSNTDLDFWDCFGQPQKSSSKTDLDFGIVLDGKPILKQNYIKLV